MKQVKITYNPYLVSTKILVDGKSPRNDSKLIVRDKIRLQEWIEHFPDILVNEYRDNSFVIEFVGTKMDFEDLETSLNSYTKAKFEYTFTKKADISDVEKEIDKIFLEIQNGPVTELKDKKITDAFSTAKNGQFEVNVIATMSSGKSTLINALLQKQLMPAANEATTATIVRIIDENKLGNKFSAVAYNKEHKVVTRIDDVSEDDMKQMNKDKSITEIEIRGKIPFVETVGMNLVLVDTPGPNNSRDDEHRAMTYEMINNSDKSLVLFVMNGQQLGINDEKFFLDYICDSMKNGNKQNRDRFLFAVNKMDAFSIKYEGTTCIENALKNAEKGLNDRGIYNPNLFPVSSLSALEMRIDEEEPMALDTFKRLSKKYQEMHFDEYYRFSHLPLTARQRIENMLQESDEDGKVEIHSGIVSIEQAISQYVNKYARTQKVFNLVESFRQKLKEVGAIENIKNSISSSEEKRKELNSQIKDITSKIDSAKQAQSVSKRIDSMDLTSAATSSIKQLINKKRTEIDRMMSGNSKVLKSEAQRQCSRLESDCKEMSAQISASINKIMEDSYKKIIDESINEYKKYLSALNLQNSNSLTINPLNLVSANLSNLSSIMNSKTKTVDESYTVKEKYQEEVFVPSKRKWYNPFSWFNEGDHYETVTKERDKRIAKYTDYVDMKDVATSYLVPFQGELDKMLTSVQTHVESETKRLKDVLKKEFDKIEMLLKDKLTTLTQVKDKSQMTEKEIRDFQSKLSWLMGIEERVKKIIEF